MAENAVNDIALSFNPVALAVTFFVSNIVRAELVKDGPVFCIAKICIDSGDDPNTLVDKSSHIHIGNIIGICRNRELTGRSAVLKNIVEGNDDLFAALFRLPDERAFKLLENVSDADVGACVVFTESAEGCLLLNVADKAIEHLVVDTALPIVKGCGHFSKLSIFLFIPFNYVSVDCSDVNKFANSCFCIGNVVII